MREFITLQPVGIFFCNINKDMNLTGHCHYADVQCTFETLGAYGFPVFYDTAEELKNFIQNLPIYKGFKGTNEELVRQLFYRIAAAVEDENFETVRRFEGSQFTLHKITVRIMGLKDANNHADGFTIYEMIKE
jgi:hypothetical protein